MLQWGSSLQSCVLHEYNILESKYPFPVYGNRLWVGNFDKDAVFWTLWYLKIDKFWEHLESGEIKVL